MLNTPVFSFLTAAMTIAGLNLLGIKSAQAVSFNTNLIVNGDAEAGSAVLLSLMLSPFLAGRQLAIFRSINTIPIVFFRHFPAQGQSVAVIISLVVAH